MKDPDFGREKKKEAPAREQGKGLIKQSFHRDGDTNASIGQPSKGLVSDGQTSDNGADVNPEINAIKDGLGKTEIATKVAANEVCQDAANYERSSGSKLTREDSYSNIPEELLRLPQWVCFSLEDGKKIPFTPGSNNRAASNRSRDWRSFKAAVKDVEEGRRQHIGFAFSSSDSFVFIDLDDPDDEDQAKLFEKIDTYAQRSVSGNGAHLICRGTFQGSGKHPAKPAAGLFKENRFVLMTGAVIDGRNEIKDVDEDVLQRIHTWLRGTKEAAETVPLVEYESDIPDMTVFQMGCDRFHKFEPLSRGHWQQFDEYHNDHSTADHAFIAMLCDLTESNEQVRWLFRASGMWNDERAAKKAGHGINGYIDRTIRKIRSAQNAALSPIWSTGEEDGKEASESHSSIVWGVNSYPTTVPPSSVILGRGWTRIGDIANFVSCAGGGKTVAATQAPMAWGLGLPYFGIRPPRPLRILLFSGEDDEVTIGQCREGFLEHSDAITGRQLTSEDLEPLESMLRIEFSREHVGPRFHTHLDRLLTGAPADLVIVNPLLSYVGGEIVACASEWLRGGLMPILQNHKCAALVVHHTPKLVKGSWDTMDDTYSGIGGGEIANVPRSILTLKPTPADGLFVVTVAKRQTTGWKDGNGHFCTNYFVKRSRDPERPAWIPVSWNEARELIGAGTFKQGTGKKKANPADVVDLLESNGEMSRQSLIAALMESCNCSDRPARDAITTAETADLICSSCKPNKNGGKPEKWFFLCDDN